MLRVTDRFYGDVRQGIEVHQRTPVVLSGTRHTRHHGDYASTPVLPYPPDAKVAVTDNPIRLDGRPDGRVQSTLPSQQARMATPAGCQGASVKNSVRGTAAPPPISP